MKKLLSLSAVLAATLVAATWPGSARAAEGGSSGDNAAIAINTKDGSSLFKLAFSLRKVAGDIVDNQNAAVAYASCESCKTTAIAIQIVLVTGSPSTVVPENYSISINENCTLCQTFSAAFQFVIGVADPSVGLSKEGKRLLREILRDFKALKKQDYTVEEFNARVKALGDRLRQVLKTELVSKRDRDEDDEESDELDEEERPSPPAAPTKTTTGGTTTGGTATDPGVTAAPPPASTEQVTTETPPPPPTTTDTTTTEPPAATGTTP